MNIYKTMKHELFVAIPDYGFIEFCNEIIRTTDLSLHADKVYFTILYKNVKMNKAGSHDLFYVMVIPREGRMLITPDAPNYPTNPYLPVRFLAPVKEVVFDRHTWEHWKNTTNPFFTKSPPKWITKQEIPLAQKKQLLRARIAQARTR